MRARYIFESLDFRRGMDPHSALGIGNEKLRDQNKLRDFAESHGFNFSISKKGVPIISFPVDFEEYLEYDWKTGSKYGWAKKMEYIITYPEGWDETPIALRKRWVGAKGTGIKQALVGRFKYIEDAIEKIEKHSSKDLLKKGELPYKR